MANGQENVDSRQEYYDGMTQAQLAAIDQDMFREQSQTPNLIAFDKPNRKTTSTTGGAKPQFADG